MPRMRSQSVPPAILRPIRKYATITANNASAGPPFNAKPFGVVCPLRRAITKPAPKKTVRKSRIEAITRFQTGAGAFGVLGVVICFWSSISAVSAGIPV